MELGAVIFRVEGVVRFIQGSLFVRVRRELWQDFR